jgi:hypothetical protein
VSVSTGPGSWKEEIKLAKSLPLEDLIWHRVHYHFDYDDKAKPALQGIESISQILQRPVIRVLGQQSYLSGSLAAVRIIVTDSRKLDIESVGWWVERSYCLIQLEIHPRWSICKNPRPDWCKNWVLCQPPATSTVVGLGWLGE